MEHIPICFLCHKEAKNNLLTLSCGHKLCKICLSRQLIITEFKSITNEEVTFKCCCDKGSLHILLNQAIKLFAFEKETKMCFKHKLIHEKYCLDCKIWICQECRKAFHDEFFKFHRLSNNEPSKSIKCKKHNIKIESYCNTCNRELCSTCLSEDKDHSDVHTNITTLIEDYRTEILSKLKSDSYQDIEKMIIEKEKISRQEITKCFLITKKKIEDIISSLTSILDSFTCQMEKDCFYSAGLFQLMKYSHYHLYQNIHSSSTPLPVLQYLRQLDKTLTDIEIIPQEIKELDFMLDSLWKVKSKGLIKFVMNFEEKTKQQTDRKIVFQTGHDEFMSSLCYINENSIVTGSVDHSIRHFNITNNPDSPFEYKGSLNEHEGAIRSICLLKDGRLATGSNDHTIKLWDLASQSCEGTFIGHSQCVRTVIQVDDSHIVSAGDDRKIIIWNIESLRSVYKLIGHETKIYKLLLMKDSRLVSCADDGIKIWGLDKHICLKTLTDHEKAVTTIIQLSDERLVSGSKDSTFKIWNPKTYYCKKSISAHTDWITAITELKNGNIATGGRDNVIKIWDIKSYQLLELITGHSNTIIDIIEIFNDKLLTASCDKNLMVFDI